MPTQATQTEDRDLWKPNQPASLPTEGSPSPQPRTDAPGATHGPGAGPQAAAAMSHWTEGAPQQAAPAPQAAPTTPFQVDGQGRVFTTGEPPVQVGFRDGSGKTYVGVDAAGKVHGSPLASSSVGTLRLGETTSPILRVEAATLKTAAAKPAAAPAQAATPAQAEDHADPAQMTPCNITPSGKQEGMLSSGEHILQASGKSLSPVPIASLSGAVRGKLNHHARIDLDNGEMWVYMDFALSDEKSSTGRWVPPGHSKAEVKSDYDMVRTEADKLPDKTQVKSEVESVLRIIGLVSSVEGKFDAVSPPSDTYASIGIFQWAMPKNSAGDNGSLGMFFSNLKERAESANARPEKERTEEDKLYIHAWEQCTKHGLDMKNGKIQMSGHNATGGEVEDAMHAEMGKGALRTYQLIAANDWIETFRGTIVRPGPSGAKWIGSEYEEQGAAGNKVQLKRGVHTFTIEAGAHATVGDLCSDEQSLAYAVMLGVNRPHYVEASLWKAISPVAAPQAKCQELLTQLDAAIAAHNGDKKKPREHEYSAAEIAAAGESAKAIYAQLQALLWPTGGNLSPDALANLPAAFKSNTMQLYNPSDARKYKREQRFSTVDAAF